MEEKILQIIRKHGAHGNVMAAKEISKLVKEFILWQIFDDYEHTPDEVKGFWQDDKYFLESSAKLTFDEIFEYWLKYKNE